METHTLHKVHVVVLNWNNVPDTLECLASVMTLPGETYDVVVVDNGSTDDSVAAIREHFPGVRILETGKNLGYAGGNNVGIQGALAAGAEFVLILNNDVIVTPDFLLPLLAPFHIQPTVGITVPLLAEASNRTRVWALGSTVDRHRGQVIRLHAGEPLATHSDRAPFDVEAAPGAAMLVKRRVFQHVGLLDEGFFLYFEESDWCLTVKQAGYQIMAVPASIVYHKVSATLGMTSPAVDYYMTRNQLYFIRRHFRGVQLPYLLARTVARQALVVAAYTAKSQHGTRTPNRNARVLALRDAALGRWGKMGNDVAVVCRVKRS